MTLRAVAQSTAGGASAPTTGSGFNNNIRTTTVATTAGTTDYTILADGTGAAYSVTLPTPASSTGRVYNIKKIDASANVITVAGTIDGVINKTLTAQWQTVTVQSDGAAWYII